MGHLQLTDISLAFGARRLLRDISLSMDNASRIALTGANGSGKTTLMKIAVGTVVPDTGTRTVKKGTRISYLPQTGVQHSGGTLTTECMKAFDYLETLQHRKEEVEETLGSITRKSENYDPLREEQLLEEHHHLEETLREKGYHMRNQRIEMVISGLGFSLDDLNRDTGEFSGGWQMRIALAKVLLERPDLLLLDEPTNYLDLEAREWLQDWIISFTGGILLVSHDRYFLDTVTNETVEIFSGTLKRYRGNYSWYERKRAEELESLVHAYEQQQEEIEKTEDFIARFRYNASRAKLVQSRIKWLEKLERIEVPETLKRIHFSFPKAPHCGRTVAEADGLTKRYGSVSVFSDASFTIGRGEKVVVTGVNGAGKSTLLKILAGLEPVSAGTVSYGKDVAAAYFAQDVEEEAVSDASVLEELEAHAPTSLIPHLKNMLGAFLFRGDDVYKPVSVLSGGEISRFALLKILLHPANFLILDEPTNHLDMHSKDVLLDALKAFSGTIMFVSHDRSFIEGLADKVFELNRGKLTIYHGDYSYYLWKLEQRRKDQPEPPSRTAGETEGRIQREEQKRARNRLKKLKREESGLMQTIEELEEEKRKTERKLHKREIYSDPQAAREVEEELKKKEEKLEKLHERWESVAARIEEGAE